MAKKVYIGVGHGGSDPGAVANGFKEKDFNLDVAKSCRDELKRHGVDVMISRESDVTENLSARIKECNTYNPDLALDIHHNAGGGDGAEVYHSKNDKTDDALAQNILNEIIAIGQNSRGMKTKLADDGTDYFGFIRQIKCPSVLVECAFIDNATDVKIVDTLAERKAMGVAIAKGILKTLNIAYVAETTATKTTSSIKKGDLVSIKSGAKYYTGKAVPNWVVKQNWYVTEVSGDRAVINKNEQGTSAINSPINVMYLTVVAKSTTTETTVKVGSTVKVKFGAKDLNTNKSLAFWAYARKYKVKSINGSRVVLTYNGETATAMDIKNLTLV